MSDKDVDKDVAFTSAEHSVRRMTDLVLELALAARLFWTAAASAVGLGESDLVALASVSGGDGMTGVQLRRILGITSSSVSELADRLERAGMLTRSRRGPDRRHVTLRATPRGTRVVDSVLDPCSAGLYQLLSERGTAEARTASSWLAEINRLFGEAAGGHAPRT